MSRGTVRREAGRLHCGAGAVAGEGHLGELIRRRVPLLLRRESRFHLRRFRVRPCERRRSRRRWTSIHISTFFPTLLRRVVFSQSQKCVGRETRNERERKLTFAGLLPPTFCRKPLSQRISEGRQTLPASEAVPFVAPLSRFKQSK